MKKYEHLPFEIILSETEGDPEAIETVMKFYDGYISKLCLRKWYDEYGNVCMVVDAELKNRVQICLLYTSDFTLTARCTISVEVS